MKIYIYEAQRRRKFINGDDVKNLTKVSLGSKIITVEVASSDEDRSRGLQSREILDEDSGMLFVFEKPGILSFWMENTYIPLSIAYLDENLKILEIHDMDPLSKESIRSSKLAKYALEVNRGWFKSNNIKAGQNIQLLSI